MNDVRVCVFTKMTSTKFSLRVLQYVYSTAVLRCTCSTGKDPKWQCLHDDVSYFYRVPDQYGSKYSSECTNLLLNLVLVVLTRELHHAGHAGETTSTIEYYDYSS